VKLVILKDVALLFVIIKKKKLFASKAAAAEVRVKPTVLYLPPPAV
jgi:hypothetical protein